MPKLKPKELQPEFTKAQRPKKVKISTAVEFATAAFVERHRMLLPRKPKPTPGRILDKMREHAEKTKFTV